MSLPYQNVAALGQDGVVAAARGPIIFTFGADGSVISSWEHSGTQRKSPSNGGATEEGASKPIDQDEASSPTKRRKIETDAGVQAVATDPKDEQTRAQGEAKGDGQKKTKRGRLSTRPSDYQGHEQPNVILLRATSTGSHLIAVTGTDKTIWVFEHDGNGQLKESSHRAMPKRPCDLTVTSDDQTLLVADKFGDVYSLPLIPSGDEEGTVTPKVPVAPVRKGADNLTVHTQRNLKALIDQERQRQLNPQPKTKEGPTFAHELLIGHVSMLTAVAAASAEGKPYILSADRDEHIRVSRGIPQAYVIENFCLGHRSFVNALALPQPDVLVSGGGDDELYVWNWYSGLLKDKADLLSHVQKVAPESSKIAVSRLVSAEGGWLVAICERVAAIFVFRFVDEKLTFAQTLQLAGNPLDLAVIAAPEQPARVVVGIDTDGPVDAASSSLVSLQVNGEGNWDYSPSVKYQDTDVKGLEASRAELDKFLYTVENLRKTDNPYDEDGGDAPAQDSEAPSTPAE